MQSNCNLTRRYTLLCEEVRTENNGKLLIIGAYPTPVFIFNKLPAALDRLVFLQFLQSTGKIACEVRVEVVHKATGMLLFSDEGKFEMTEGELANPIVVPRLQFGLSGDYEFRADFGPYGVVRDPFQVMTLPDPGVPFRP